MCLIFVSGAAEQGWGQSGCENRNLEKTTTSVGYPRRVLKNKLCALSKLLGSRCRFKSLQKQNACSRL